MKRTKTAEIALKEYEEECEELLMKIREPVKKSLADAGLKLSDIDEVLLIGGATRLSVVRDFLIRLFRKFPDTRLNRTKPWHWARRSSGHEGTPEEVRKSF